MHVVHQARLCYRVPGSRNGRCRDISPEEIPQQPLWSRSPVAGTEDSGGSMPSAAFHGREQIWRTQHSMISSLIRAQNTSISINMILPRMTELKYCTNLSNKKLLRTGYKAGEIGGLICVDAPTGRTIHPPDTSGSTEWRKLLADCNHPFHDPRFNSRTRMICPVSSTYNHAIHGLSLI
jgi:hypothetical protein